MSTDSLTRFADFALAAPILAAVEEVGYETPSPIQAEAIPPLLEGRDLLGQAQTGTGKTAAFALPLLSRIDVTRREPQVLVLTPTRELAIQVAEAMQTYGRHLRDFHILPVYGGQGMDIQLRQLRRGVQVVVGTPGRVMDHMRRGTLSLDALSALVLDEADEMLRMGFIDDVEWILSHTPAERQVALFSATLPEAIRRVARQHLREPVEIRIRTKTATVETIAQRYWQVSGLHKLDALTRILEVEDFDAMIVFVRTKTATVELAEKLEARGYSSSPLNGDMNQTLREKAVERLKNGALDILVATDVAARGLDVERISHVINYDIPNDTEAYVHRIGRTGRAGRKGAAILFVSPRERRMLYAIEKATRQPITPMSLPSREDIADRRVGRFKQAITEALEQQELGFFEDLIGAYQREHDVGVGEIASALAFLLQRERPLVPDLTERPSPRDGEVPREAGRRERPSRSDRESRGAWEPDAERTPRFERDARPEREARPPRETRPEREPRFERDTRPEQQPRGDGPPAGERTPTRGRPPRPDSAPEQGMERYRIEVGKEHGVLPKHIVGAIANEAGLESRHIGRITLHDTYSTLDLPEGMPKEVFRHLQKVWVCGRPLKIARAGDSAPAPRKGKRGKNED